MKKRWKIKITVDGTQFISPNGKDVYYSSSWGMHKCNAIRNAKSFNKAVAREILEQFYDYCWKERKSELHPAHIEQFLSKIDSGEAGIRMEVEG